MIKQIMYWLLGKQAGRVIEVTWRWLWNVPLEQDAKIRGQVLDCTLAEIQQTVSELTQAVAKQQSAYTIAQKQYAQKVEEHQRLSQHAIAAQRSSNEDAVRLAASRLIQLETLLPQLAHRLQQAEQYVTASRQQLKSEQFKVEQLKQEIQTAKELDAITEILNTIYNLHNQFNPSSAENTIKQVVNLIEVQHEDAKALSEIAQHSSLQDQLKNITQNEQFHQRLQQIQTEAAQHSENSSIRDRLHAVEN